MCRCGTARNTRLEPQPSESLRRKLQIEDEGCLQSRCSPALVDACLVCAPADDSMDTWSSCVRWWMSILLANPVYSQFCGLPADRR